MKLVIIIFYRSVSQTVPYHYYEPSKMNECQYYNKAESSLTGGHLFITEKAIFKNWAVQTKKINFKFPEWPLPDSTNSIDTPFLNKFWDFVNGGGNMSLILEEAKLRELRKRAMNKGKQYKPPPKVDNKDTQKKKQSVVVIKQGVKIVEGKKKVSDNKIKTIPSETLPKQSSKQTIDVASRHPKAEIEVNNETTNSKVKFELHGAKTYQKVEVDGAKTYQKVGIDGARTYQKVEVDGVKTHRKAEFEADYPKTFQKVR